MPALPYAARRGWRGGWPRNQPAVLLVVIGLTVIHAVVSGLWPRIVPLAWVVVLIMLAGYLLQLRYLLLFYAVLVPATLLTAWMRDGDPIAPGVWPVLLAAAVLMTMFVRTREVLGVQGNTGQAMLVDLRDRLRAQARPPRMPAGLHMEVAQLSANGEGFSGDFVLSAVRPGQLHPVADDRRGGRPAVDGATDWPGALEVALVDVSGKGQGAGTRALLLSGGLSGLLGGVDVAHFLPAANSYLLRQSWQEGFATALHLVLDPRTGEFAVRSAGHPAPVHHRAATGVWHVLEAPPEPALGLLEEPDYDEVRGRLDHGDAVVLFTDGVVEARGRDLGYGIDRLVGQLARHVRRGYRGAAAAGVAAPRGGSDDDRTVVLVWRE